MATKINTGWLFDNDGTVFAPKTLMSQVMDNNGNLLSDQLYSNRYNYCECYTSKNSSTKIISLANFKLVYGAEITVRFIFGNASSETALNVNGTGAIPVSYKGLSSYLTFKENSVYSFKFNGSEWELIGDIATFDSLGLIASVDELNHMKGVSENVQKQLDDISNESFKQRQLINVSQLNIDDLVNETHQGVYFANAVSEGLGTLPFVYTDFHLVVIPYMQIAVASDGRIKMRTADMYNTYYIIWNTWKDVGLKNNFMTNESYKVVIERTDETNKNPLTYTAPSDGLVTMSGYTTANHGSAVWLKVNDIEVGKLQQNTENGSTSFYQCSFKVYAGDIISGNASSMPILTFYPVTER